MVHPYCLPAAELSIGVFLIYGIVYGLSMYSSAPLESGSEYVGREFEHYGEENPCSLAGNELVSGANELSFGANELWFATSEVRFGANELN